jgi:hypothetical protein
VPPIIGESRAASSANPAIGERVAIEVSVGEGGLFDRDWRRHARVALVYRVACDACDLTASYASSPKSTLSPKSTFCNKHSRVSRDGRIQSARLAMMKSTILPGAIAFSFLLLFASAGPAAAQHVISNPGWCAQFYPNANCQNYGRGNPYTSYGWQRGHRHHWNHRYHRRHWR